MGPRERGSRGSPTTQPSHPSQHIPDAVHPWSLSNVSCPSLPSPVPTPSPLLWNQQQPQPGLRATQQCPFLTDAAGSKTLTRAPRSPRLPTVLKTKSTLPAGSTSPTTSLLDVPGGVKNFPTSDRYCVLHLLPQEAGRGSGDSDPKTRVKQPFCGFRGSGRGRGCWLETGRQARHALEDSKVPSAQPLRVELRGGFCMWGC